MGSFLEAEKPHQARFKRESPHFSDAARPDGFYPAKPRSFCVPADHAEENLFEGIRTLAIEWFKSHGIHWHDGYGGKPSNHLCDSQVCGVNFLFPFADRPGPLASLLRPLFPDLKRMLPIEDGKFVAFEWIGGGGDDGYLKERRRPGSRRTRGANFTSADAAVAFDRADGKKQVVLVEWKYTESYGGNSIKVSKSGTDRTAIYRWLFDEADCPIDKALLPSFESLFYEPFYQLMRQQLLAHEMEKAQEEIGEFRANVVSLLHVAPSHNKDFRKVTSPELVPLGDTATGVWKRLVKPSGRFLSVSTEALFAPLLAEPPTGMQEWAKYLAQRYPWATEDKATPCRDIENVGIAER